MSDDLTTIDWLKTAALAFMIVDHVGFFLFPDSLWVRAIGRLSMPFWMFLIGYARTRDVPGRWFAAVVILGLSNLLIGLSPLPLSILMTMALTRVAIDPFWRFVTARPYYFWWIILLLIFAGYPTNLFTEYGTLGFVMALAGYAVRNRAAAEDSFGPKFPEKLMAASLAAYGAIFTALFGFGLLQAMVIAAGLLCIYFVLIDFQGKTLPGTAGRAQSPLIRFTGRYTLEIYVIHLLVLKLVYALHLAAQAIL